jgi:hypothetical protein
VSGYQYYEFVAVDRPLGPGQMAQLRALSTRARITPAGFVNSYQWGDLKGDPRVLLERHFDAFLYVANWGTHRVMFRLPARLLGQDVADRYCRGDSAQAWTAGEQVVLEWSSEDEDGDWETDGEGLLAGIVPARAELVGGDLRVLYLAWLGCAQAGEFDPGEPEPPVPPGLADLSAAQTSLADFLRIDDDLLVVAAAASPPGAGKQPSTAALTRWVGALPAADKDAALLRLLRGDDPHLRADLLRRFHGNPTAGDTGRLGSRTAGELLDAARACREERRREADRRRAAEQVRVERAAAAAREQRLQGLADREDEAWLRAAALIDTKRPTDYDAAVDLLRDLQAVSERTGAGAVFTRRMQQLREQHRRKPSLIERLHRAGLTDTGRSEMSGIPR